MDFAQFMCIYPFLVWVLCSLTSFKVSYLVFLVVVLSSFSSIILFLLLKYKKYKKYNGVHTDSADLLMYHAA